MQMISPKTCEFVGSEYKKKNQGWNKNKVLRKKSLKLKIYSSSQKNSPEFLSFKGLYYNLTTVKLTQINFEWIK